MYEDVNIGRCTMSTSLITLVHMENRTRARTPRGIEIGRRVKRLREANKLTQAELGDAIYTSRSTVAHIEGGYYVASIPMIDELARALSVDVEALVGTGDIEDWARFIERKRASHTLYGDTAAASEVENIQIFTSMMRDIDRLNLPENVKQMLREDVERIKREAGNAFRGS